jgi:hypothetical protein
LPRPRERTPRGDRRPAHLTFSHSCMDPLKIFNHIPKDAEALVRAATSGSRLVFSARTATADADEEADTETAAAKPVVAEVKVETKKPTVLSIPGVGHTTQAMFEAMLSRATVFRGNGAGSAAHYFVGTGMWGTA